MPQKHPDSIPEQSQSISDSSGDNEARKERARQSSKMYRERNSYLTQQAARLRMQKRRANMSDKEKQAAKAKRAEYNRTYWLKNRERLSKEAKEKRINDFLAKGHSGGRREYYPRHRLCKLS
ncbi:hypothetical protein MPER_07029 [Moniliophthora perniciosa FA553]|nr:hypothetical protein MPER_07029 [Moniliophthora perniciosa FA553]